MALKYIYTLYIFKMFHIFFRKINANYLPHVCEISSTFAPAKKYTFAYEMKKSTLLLLLFFLFGIADTYCQTAPNPISPSISGVLRPVRRPAKDDSRNRVITKKYVRHFDRRGRLIRHEEYWNGSLVSEYICSYSGSHAYPVSRCNKRLLDKKHHKEKPEVIGRVIRKEHYSTGELKSVDSIVCLRFQKTPNIKLRNVPEDDWVLSKAPVFIENDSRLTEKLVAAHVEQQPGSAKSRKSKHKRPSA